MYRYPIIFFPGCGIIHTILFMFSDIYFFINPLYLYRINSIEVHSNSVSIKFSNWVLFYPIIIVFKMV